MTDGDKVTEPSKITQQNKINKTKIKLSSNLSKIKSIGADALLL